MACRAEDDVPLEEQPAAPLPQPQAVPDPPQIEYDFIEPPSQDFFCPVTLELLTEPHLTICCGNHLSQEAAQRLQRDRKPCPMCKEPQLNTVQNKHYMRKVNELKVHCPHKKSGCEWVGGVNEVKQHSQSCPKRPWQCQYCPFASTYDIGVSKHVPKCMQYPVVCPNCCEVGTVPRCEVEAHLMVCPLEPVACEYAEVGCDVKVPRRDLARHMEEGQQQHLLSATLLNLRLTRENTEERNRLHRMIQEKDETIAECGRKLEEKETEYKQELIAKDQSTKERDMKIQEKDKAIAKTDEKIKRHENRIVDLQKQLKEKGETVTELRKQMAVKDHCIKERDEKIEEKDKTIAKRDETIAGLQKQLKRMQDGLEAKVTNLQQQVVKYGEDTQQHLTRHDKHVESMFVKSGTGLLLYDLQPVARQGFTLHEFSKCQAKGGNGDWYSEPFYSHPGGYKFQLRIDGYSVRGVYMSLWSKLLQGDHDDKLEWPITHTAHVQLLNQLGDHGHHEKSTYNSWSKGDIGCSGGLIPHFIKLTELGLNADKNTQYLRNDCLHFRVYFKTQPYA